MRAPMPRLFGKYLPDFGLAYMSCAACVSRVLAGALFFRTLVYVCVYTCVRFFSSSCLSLFGASWWVLQRERQRRIYILYGFF